MADDGVPADLGAGLGDLEAVAAEVAGPLGEGNLCVVEDELQGYARTPLEERAVAAVEAVGERVRDDPRALDGPALERVLRCALRFQRGVDSYRARMLKAAGDYDDEASPLAHALDDLFDRLKSALRALDGEGRTPLAEVAPEVLKADLRMVVMGRYDLRQEVYRYLLDEDMATARERVFADLAREDMQALELQALELATAPLAQAREQALRALAWLGCRCGREGRARVLEALMGALGDPNLGVAIEVREQLASLGEIALGPLLDVLCDQGRAALHERALSALEDLVKEHPPYGRPAAQVLERLFEALPATEKALQERIRRLQGRLDVASEPWLVEFLAGRMRDPRPVVAEAAFLLLAPLEVRDPGLVPGLRDLLEAPQPRLGSWAAARLVDLGTAGRAVLREALDGGDAALRSLVLAALSGLAAGARGLLPPVLAALGDDDAGVRLAAAGALETAAFEVRDDDELREALRARTEAPLSAALEDPSGLVRCAAAEALHGLAAGTYPLSKVLLPLVAEGPREVRIAALRVAGRAGAAAEPLLAAVEAAAEDPDEEVAEQARCTLEVLRDPL